MNRDLSLKKRPKAKLPPEKLYAILCGIYPEKMAQELFNNLQKPPKKGGNKNATD